MSKIQKLENTDSVILKANKSDVFTIAEGTLISMTDTFDVAVKKHKSLKNAIEKMLSGHKIFLEEYTAKENGEIILSDDKLGDTVILNLDGSKKYILERRSFMASYGDIDLTMKEDGLAGIKDGRGLFVIEVTGTGVLCLSGYGSIIKKDLNGDSIIIDLDHVILRDTSLSYELVYVENTKNVDGEGKAAKISGVGSVWYQTKTFSSFISTAEL